jgi:polyadenylate-binding protein
MFSQRDPTVRRSNVGNLFVKNLAAQVTSRDLHDAFREFGRLLSVKVATFETGASKCYGFVHFDTAASANRAIEEVNGMEFMGGQIKVENYLPKDKRETAPEEIKKRFALEQELARRQRTMNKERTP